jgi:hypothetical protein
MASSGVATRRESLPDATAGSWPAGTKSTAERYAGVMHAATTMVHRCHGAQGTRPVILRLATMSC